MNLHLGIDVGSVSVKLALIAPSSSENSVLEAVLNNSKKFFTRPKSSDFTRPGFIVSEFKRLKGEPAKEAIKLLRRTLELIPGNAIGSIGITGSGGRKLAESLDFAFFNDFLSTAEGLSLTEPQVRTVFEMGGEISKYMLLFPDPESGKLRLSDYEMSGECAAGTGSFIDQQALRLDYQVEDIGALVTATDRCPTIAGRCSVFAKSDMIHAQQKGYKPPEILKGLCEAVSRNFKSAICKGKDIVPPVAFIGGVALNDGIVESLRSLFELEEHELFVPEQFAWMGAIGAAWLSVGNKTEGIDLAEFDRRRNARKGPAEFPASDPLDLSKVKLLRDRTKEYVFPKDVDRIDAFLGIDIGSISTNLVVVDRNGDLVYEIYTRTRSRPIEVVGEGLLEIEREIGDRINVKAVGTTGSGRELIGELIGADAIHDEITAHQTGANAIAGKLLGTKVDTIFEIGGQDSKFIRLEDGIVVDFTMNEACAAGTGSFLEERAEELGIQIKGEFADLALQSKRPIRLGERCTVFIESDVKHYIKRGAPIEDVVAGLAYSVGYNYINRVVRGRDIGGIIFFQGGTAYNDAVAAAFSKILDAEIIVPPHNGVVGAFGVALLAKEKMEALGWKSTFRGFHLDQVNFDTKEFTCKACSNFCDIIRFEIEGSPSYWGDRCSDRYRKKAKVDKKPVVKDLFAEREKLLLDDWDPETGNGISVGVPRAMFYFERFPFWNGFLRELGIRVVLSDPTNTRIVGKGYEATIAEPCFPIKVAHGHIADLMDKEVDQILLPNNINSDVDPDVKVNSFYCPWNTTLPFMAGNARNFASYRERILSPTMKFRNGPELVSKELARVFKPLGFGKRSVTAAVEAGYIAQEKFREGLAQLGLQALDTLEEKEEKGIILVGRPYNIYDLGANLSTPEKLRKNYGVNLVPIDFLPLGGIDISDVNENMYWNYGRKIIEAARFIRGNENLHLIYITNFKCGPDSYIKHFIVEASGKPYLTLQFDGHANDAGVMTRCEAYLESKGMLRWWSEK